MGYSPPPAKSYSIIVSAILHFGQISSDFIASHRPYSRVAHHTMGIGPLPLGRDYPTDTLGSSDWLVYRLKTIHPRRFWPRVVPRRKAYLCRIVPLESRARRSCASVLALPFSFLLSYLLLVTALAYPTLRYRKGVNRRPAFHLAPALWTTEPRIITGIAHPNSRRMFDPFTLTFWAVHI